MIDKDKMKPPLPHEVRKPSKTLAGVTPIAVMCKPKKCNHGTCVYCPSLGVPQSYTPKSPPVLRASLLNYDPYEQVKARLKAFKLMNHPTSKIELIIMGGNFLEYPLSYQYNFIKRCYDALNPKVSKTLEEAKKLNEKAKHRCVALCIESRPDTLTKKTIKRILKFGATRVEIGVQCLDDKIYSLVQRHHKVKDVIEATALLRNHGFKIGYHMMLGLPGSNKKKDIEMFKELFRSPNFRPDQLKIYPCQVVKGAILEEWYKQKKYSPYSTKELTKLLVRIMKLIPNYCRVMRVMREIPPDYLVAGTIRIDLRRDVEAILKKLKAKIKEIRFREIGFALRDKKKSEEISTKLKLKITKYEANNGTEYFLEFVNPKNILFALCRLRIFKENKKETKKLRAFIRELHVYGKAVELSKTKNKNELEIQHKGLGKTLLQKAEEIARKHKVKKLQVISGVGVREYYRKLGYTLDKDKIYMEKKL